MECALVRRDAQVFPPGVYIGDDRIIDGRGIERVKSDRGFRADLVWLWSEDHPDTGDVGGPGATEHLLVLAVDYVQFWSADVAGEPGYRFLSHVIRLMVLGLE